MPTKKKTRKKIVKPIKLKTRTVEFWGMLSCTFGIFYLAYFVYIAFVAHYVQQINFIYIMYAFTVFPFGLPILLSGIFALHSEDKLGFAGIFCSLVGAIAYIYTCYEVVAIAPVAAR